MKYRIIQENPAYLISELVSQWLHTIYKLIIEMHVGIFNIQHCHYFTMQYYDITYYMVNEQLQNIFHELLHKD